MPVFNQVIVPMSTEGSGENMSKSSHWRLENGTEYLVNDAVTDQNHERKKILWICEIERRVLFGC